jgi:hypothetical protein
MKTQSVCLIVNKTTTDFRLLCTLPWNYCYCFLQIFTLNVKKLNLVAYLTYMFIMSTLKFNHPCTLYYSYIDVHHVGFGVSPTLQLVSTVTAELVFPAGYFAALTASAIHIHLP